MITNARVAFATNDGTTITQHFGRLKGFVIADIEDGAVTKTTEASRPSNADNAGGRGHNHAALLSPVADCDTLVAGGMGLPMAEHARAAGLNLILTSVGAIDEALNGLLGGVLVHEPELAHQPRHR